MYFIIAPFIVLGLITKLINNKINIQKQNNGSSVDVPFGPSTLPTISLSDMISSYKKQITKKADHYDFQKHNISQIKKKEANS